MSSDKDKVNELSSSKKRFSESQRQSCLEGSISLDPPLPHHNVLYFIDSSYLQSKIFAEHDMIVSPVILKPGLVIVITLNSEASRITVIIRAEFSKR
jgi:hypothetical protein